MVVPACVNQKYLHTIIRQGRRLKFLYMAICDGKSLMSLWAGFGDVRLTARLSFPNVYQGGTLWKRCGMANASSSTSL